MAFFQMTFYQHLKLNATAALTCLNSSFSLYLTKGPKNLECYITLGWKGSQGQTL